MKSFLIFSRICSLSVQMANTTPISSCLNFGVRLKKIHNTERIMSARMSKIVVLRINNELFSILLKIFMLRFNFLIILKR